MENYINMSIELHLFFARIMKEHAIFLESAFQQKDYIYRNRAEEFKVQFENILKNALRIADGLVRPSVIESGELVTPYTLKAEEETQQLTGIAINKCITCSEQRLQSFCPRCMNRHMASVQMLNQNAVCLLKELIDFKEKILEEVTCCRLYTANYPLLLEHIIREAKLYYSFLTELQNTGRLSSSCMRQTEQFWNQIMMEHALFIRGLLDPTEDELIETADEFALEYKDLLKAAQKATDCTMNSLTEKSKEVTLRYRDFKSTGTQGITNCEIASIILPLLADHVLREANHYLRLLNE